MTPNVEIVETPRISERIDKMSSSSSEFISPAKGEDAAEVD
jgi:hypothetical protein